MKKINIGDTVYLRKGGTPYTVTRINGPNIYIKEGEGYREQVTDISLIVKVVK